MPLNLLPGWPLPVIAIALPLFFALLLGAVKFFTMLYMAYVSHDAALRRVYLKFPFFLFLCFNLVLNFLIWSRVQGADPTHFVLGAAGWTETLATAGSGAWKASLRFDTLGALSSLLAAFIALVSGLRSLADRNDPISQGKVFYFLLTLGGVTGIFYAGGTFSLFFFLLLSQIGASGLYRPVPLKMQGLKSSFLEALWYYLSRVMALGSFLAGCVLLYWKYGQTSFTLLHGALQPDAATLAAYALLVVPLFFLFIKSASYVLDSSKRCYFAIRSYAAFFAMLRVIFLLFGQMQGLQRIPWLFILLGSLALLFAFFLSIVDRDPIRFTEAMELFLKGFVTVSLGLSINGLASAAAAAESGFSALESMLTLWMLFLPISAALSIIGGHLKQQYGGRELWMYGGLSHSLPFTGFVFFVAVCGLAGLPPFPGFLSRQVLYRAANSVNPFLTVFLFAVSLALLFIGVWYLSGVLFGKAPRDEEQMQGDIQIALPLFLLLFFLAYTSVMPARYYNSAVTKSISSLITVSQARDAGGAWDAGSDAQDDEDAPDVEPIPQEAD